MTGIVTNKNTNHNQWRFLVLITLGAWSLRMFLAWLAYGGKDIVGTLWPRGVEELGIAKSLLSGEGFSSPFAIPTGPTAFLPPVYPVILAGIERVFGVASKPSAWLILAMQCAFSALTCSALYYLGLQCFDRKIARRAAWIWALFPYAVLLPTNIIWESSLSALLMTALVLLIARVGDSRSLAPWILIGTGFAIACLVNAAFLLLLPAFLIYLALSRCDRRRFVFCGAAFLACLIPWTIRNYVTFHKAFPLRDNFGLELWIGNRDGASTGFDPNIHPAFSMSELHEYQRVGESAYMSNKTHDALEYIQRKPVVFVENTAKRVLTYWFVSLPALWLLIPLVSLFGLTGLGLLFYNLRASAWIFAIPLLIYPMPYYLTHPDMRYQHPLQPLLSVLAAYLLSRVR